MVENKTNPTKQLLDLPNKVLEKIFSSLEFRTKKKLSQCFKRFNEIFGLPRNLDKVRFKIGWVSFIYISRQYRHFRDLGDQLGNNVWSEMNITSYICDPDSELFSTNRPPALIDMFPHFENLTCLDLEEVFFESSSLDGKQKHEVVELENLQSLKIRLHLFTLLVGRFVTFSTTKLRELHVTETELSDVLLG